MLAAGHAGRFPAWGPGSDKMSARHAKYSVCSSDYLALKALENQPLNSPHGSETSPPK